MTSNAVRWTALLTIGIVTACFSDKSDDVSGPELPNYVSCSSGAPAPPSNARVVRIRNFAFDAAQVSAPSGTTVWWINCEDAGTPSHTSTSDTNVWASPLLAPGDTYSRQFTTAGSFPYHCTPHPTMKGTVTIS
jgi:plastocyanin